MIDNIKDKLKLKIYKDITGPLKLKVERIIQYLCSLTYKIASKLDVEGESEFIKNVVHLPLIQFCKSTIEQPGMNKQIKTESLLALEQLSFSHKIRKKFLEQDAVGLLIDLALS